MSIIEKPTKDKVLIVSEARSGSTALWTYLWTKYYQNGAGGKPVRSFLEPFNFQFYLDEKSENRANREAVANKFMKYHLLNKDSPWLVKILLPAILPIEKQEGLIKVISEINGEDPKWFKDPDNPTKQEIREKVRKWKQFFTEGALKGIQQNVVGDLFYNDPSVYRIKLYRRDIIATMMSRLDLKIREKDFVPGETVKMEHWHAKVDTVDDRKIYEYPDLSEMSVKEIASGRCCQFWRTTIMRENLINFGASSNPGMKFDAEYAYEDIKDELLNFNPVIEFDKDNPMHVGNSGLIKDKTGITVTKKAENYDETYELVTKAYRSWHKHWPNSKENLRLDKLRV